MKFYVKSRRFEVVVAGSHITSPREAAKEAFLMYYKDDILISPLVIVSERGFDFHTHESSDDRVFDTCAILKEAGFLFEDE